MDIERIIALVISFVIIGVLRKAFKISKNILLAVGIVLVFLLCKESIFEVLTSLIGNKW